MYQFPTSIKIKHTFLELNKTGRKVAKLNWRILETREKSGDIVWWYYVRRWATPIAALLTDGTFCIGQTDQYHVRRLISRVSPFYCYMYGRKARLHVNQWFLKEMVQQTPAAYYARNRSNAKIHWRKYTGWMEFAKARVATEAQFHPVGDIVATAPHIELGPGMVPLIGCIKYCAKVTKAGTPRSPVKNPRCALTWQQILKEIPLLHNIGVLLRDEALLKITVKRKWWSHLGIVSISLQKCADHMYDHLKVNYPNVTKVSIKKALASIPIRYRHWKYNQQGISSTQLQALRTEYEVAEKKLLEDHPDLVEN